LKPILENVAPGFVTVCRQYHDPRIIQPGRVFISDNYPCAHIW